MISRSPRYVVVTAVIMAVAIFWNDPSRAEERLSHTFERQQLTDIYFSEGANAGDLNHDGHADIVYGPYWFEGPQFKQRHEIYAAKPQPREAYADNFFSWVHDFNGDGWNDVFVVGFPGTPAYVYENPAGKNLDQPWKKHQVLDSVSNESPQFVDIVGDSRPELVCTQNGFFGFATIDWDRPLEKWSFRAVSDKSAPEQFGHGLGVGDVDGDGRQDILTAGGWFQQPAETPTDSRWVFHQTPLTNAYGGAEMYAYDVDGDGDNDIITSLAAHDYGLAWYEQDRSGPTVVFRQHLIVGSKPEQNRYGVVFSELHSVALADIDGDGLKDIVTGKTYFSHHMSSPMWDAGAVVYWLRLVRTADGVDWVPYRIDGEAGIGRQISVQDVNGDKLPDIVVGGMKGSHVLLHRAAAVSESEWQAAQPKAISPASTELRRGPRSKINATTSSVEGALEGESLQVLKVSSGQTATQAMSGFTNDVWSGGQQMFWNGAKPGDRLDLEFEAAKDDEYDLTAVLTMARDYGIVQVSVDDVAVGKPLDLYNFPDVLTTGTQTLGSLKLKSGKHRLTLEIKGANTAAEPSYMVGLDYLRLVHKGAADTKAN